MVEQQGWLVRGVDERQVVRVIGVDVTDAAERVRVAHGLWADAAALAAEGCAATALLAAHIKGEERLSLQVQGEEPRVAFTGEVDAEGHIRARLTPPNASRTQGKLSGMLLAMKSDAKRELYRGMTEITDASLEEALANHLTRSSQVDCILRLHVEQDSEGGILWAGGFYVERLPEHEVHAFVTPEEFQARFGGLLQRDPAEVVIELRAGLLGESGFAILEEKAIEWQCRCGQEKVEAMLYALGENMLRDMLVEDKGASVQCHFCNEEYTVSERRIAEILADVQGN
ncbi:MAG: Hsp33 family molecular chaperone HslO [Deltaproteobacteria bacterium]|nr:MAG: Hsp33 family molecular chaperone HslO [Deltaproteobacteria bacterium]